MKKWELKSLIDKLEGKIISLQMDNGQLRTRVRNLKEGVDRQKERVNRHNEREEELEKELVSLRNDRDCIQESLDEFGSDTVEVIEMCLKDRLTEEEMTIYREGMKVYKRGVEMINNGRELAEDEIAFLHSLPAIPITRQEVREMVQEAIVSACS